MAYVVIVCSRCRLARGAPETAKTASCPGCGRKLRVPELRKYYRSESLSRLAEAIGQLNARLRGGLDIYLGDLHESVPDRPLKAKKPGDGDEREAASVENREAAREEKADRESGRCLPANKLDRAILLSLSGRGSVSPEELQALLPVKCTVEQLQRRLEALRRAGMLFEPKAGKYALVE